MEFEAHSDDSLIHSFLTLQLHRRASQLPPAQFAHKSTWRKPSANSTINSTTVSNSLQLSPNPYFRTPCDTITVLFILHNHAAPFRPPMRRAPVVSLHSQPPLLNTAPLRSGLSIWQRPFRHLPCAPVTLEWLASAIVSAHPKAPAPPESTPGHSTASLAAHAQSRTACLAPSHSSSDQDSDYTSSTTVGTRARCK